ncbi:MAG TPA: O-antigen ligase family protein [Thermoanaerobaculia bacterium]|nr:O-antigen ligase family protein [Thermoanaerobaculia bacterium]
MTIIETTPVLPPKPTGALRVMQLGAVAIVAAVATLHVFELDRFFVPKELVLHLTALIAGYAAVRVSMTRVDRLLALFLLVSAVSALFATNPWLAVRAVAVSVSGVVLFWIARALREGGLGRPLLNTLAFAVVLCAVTSLLQTYGVELTIFSENRAPGGTLGNRNFVAHIAAFGLPLVLLTALRGRSVFPGAIGATIVIASLVLTRSRAAWLAFAAVLIVFCIALLASAAVRRDGRTWRRLAMMAILIVGGVAAALLIPNTLKWRSDNPYLETVKRVADYQEGSGRGRLVQYEQSMRMALRHPILGVGPGNWAVEYPEHAARHDPSLSDSEGGATSNPWPSSDWVAMVAERGPVAAVLLALAFLSMFADAVKQLRTAVDVDEGLLAATLLGVIVGAGVTGMFDAVLLLAVPTFLVWAALGALSVPTAAVPARRIIPIILIVIAGLGAARSSMQLIAMQIYATRGDRASLTRAAWIDPGNYRVRLRLARMGRRQQRCEHALAARALFPHADAARDASRGCDN